MFDSALYVIPSASGTLAAIGVWSSSLFDDLLGMTLLGAGLIVGGMLAWFIGASIIRAVVWLVHGQHTSATGEEEISEHRRFGRMMKRPVGRWKGDLHT